MFGDDILVCPITSLGQREREVYFPQGEIWLDPYTMQEYAGGTTSVVNAPVERIPVFVRKNAELDINIFKD